MAQLKYKRIMLKLSGELLMGDLAYGVDLKYLKRFGSELKELAQAGVEVIVEVGGGNIYRWRSAQPGISRNTADMMGMLGSVMSALNLRDGIESLGGKAEALSPLMMPLVIPYYTPRRANKHLQDGKIVIVGGGTGRQFYTTDSGAAEHALQTNCEVLFKGTDVDGVYNSDPKKNPQAKKYEQLSFGEALEKQLGVMDMTAFALCRDNNLPIVVFNIQKSDNIKKAVMGEQVGTLVQ